MKKTILYTCMLFVLSCQQETQEANIIQYFDTEVFVAKEIETLSKMNWKAKKEVSLNGITERIENIEVDSSFLYQEFQLFRDANINKSALLGKYKMDSTWSIDPHFTLEEISSIRYSSLDETLKTDFIEFQSTDLAKKLVGVSALLSSKNFMHAYQKELHYLNYDDNNLIMTVSAWEKIMFQDTLFYTSKITIGIN